MNIPRTRRELLGASLGSLIGFSLTGWMPRLARCAERSDGSHKRCILLWMDGGPSHVDTFDPKPDAPADVRGPLDAIETSVAGIHFGERFPRLAAMMQHLCVIRGMSTLEADHGRARTYMHTGYRPGQGGLTYPGLGSIVSAELGRLDFPLPNFVATGRPLGKYDFLTDPGYLGPQHGALIHDDPDRTLENLAPLPSADVFRLREQALAESDAEFLARNRAAAVEGRRAVFDRAIRLMRAEAAQAFDIRKEPDAVQQAYGEHRFARGCLLARRLVEAGVPFVEVYLENWDTHEKRVADAALELMPIVDRAMAALINDLHERGLLDETLVVWMGEFGRTPRINRNGGRDHYAKAWTTMLAGGGLRGGQVIGRTDASGASVVDRPVSAIDFLATVCRSLGIDYRKRIDTPIGRPVTLVDAGAAPIAELFP